MPSILYAVHAYTLAERNAAPMIHRCPIGTDVAQLALWDAQHTRTDTESLSLEELDEILRADARGGRLFFVNTGSDGGCDIALYVDEPIPDDLLPFYKSLNRRFLLRCPSGRLLAGGAEGYTDLEGQASGEAARIPSGDYVLQLHELCEGDVNEPERLSVVLGEEDYAYLHRAGYGWGWGCIGVVGGILLAGLIHWTWGLPFVVAGIGWTLQNTWRNRHDNRLKEIQQRVSEYNEQYPFFLFSLQKIEGDTDLTGGWHNLVY